MTRIRRVAVLGAGTMGSRIAAQFANAGIPALLLDLVKPGSPDRSAIARAAIAGVLKGRPGGFFTPETAKRVEPGNFEDHLGQLAECDWIIEAVAENLEIKRGLLAKVAAARKPGTILSTNTSGIPLARIAEGFDDELSRHFLGTHFFNPPRYLHLVEVIPGPATDPAVIDFVSAFCDVRLGKGAAPCKDTPNFIANRIGSFFGATVHKLTVEEDLTIEEVDLLTGPLIGLPKSASYRLLDIVGLDIWAHVTVNLRAAVPNDPWRDRFVLPDFLNALMERRWLGDKTGQGCYKRVGKEREIWALDRKTLDYHPAAKARFASTDAARNIEDLSARLKALIAATDKAGVFLWKLLSDHVIYAAERVPEISDRIVEVDRAMRWGYANQLGPFELWDAMGLRETAKRIETEGRAIPPSVERLLSEGGESFYRAADADGTPRTQYVDLAAGGWRDLEPRPGVTVLREVKRARGVVKSNAGASLIDLGDGVLGLEFHSKMNTIGEDFVQMIHVGVEETERNFAAMVVANQGDNFCAGANLMLVLLAAQEAEWDDLDQMVRRFQNACLAMKYAAKPVVAAPFGLALGGGAEIAMHAARIQASAELYMGLVEVGVGVIPAGGGCKEMLLRLGGAQKAFETIGYAKTSTSAADARAIGYLREADGITMNAERLINDAKRIALSLAPGYAPPLPPPIAAEGDAGYALLKIGVYMAREGGYISEHDALIGEKLAVILSGGRGAARTVGEQQILDLEREAFLSLCGTPKTQERMQHMLKTGKALRN